MKRNTKQNVLNAIGNTWLATVLTVAIGLTLFTVFPEKAYAGISQFKLTYDEAAAILGVSPSASEKEVKTAWRKYSKMYHPDTGGATANEEKFKAKKEAYERIRFANFDRYTDPVNPSAVKDGDAEASRKAKPAQSEPPPKSSNQGTNNSNSGSGSRSSSAGSDSSYSGYNDWNR